MLRHSGTCPKAALLDLIAPDQVMLGLLIGLQAQLKVRTHIMCEELIMNTDY